VHFNDDGGGGPSAKIYEPHANSTIPHGQQHSATSSILHTAMRLQRHVPLFKSTLKRVSASHLLPSTQWHRHFASSSTAYPERIAILGGGISGLASAHFVAKEFPNSKITIYEEQKEAGGWLRSRRVEVENGSVLFEYGPRSLRPGVWSYPTAQMVNLQLCMSQHNEANHPFRL
jgi:hypothetical protein